MSRQKAPISWLIVKRLNLQQLQVQRELQDLFPKQILGLNGKVIGFYLLNYLVQKLIHW